MLHSSAFHLDYYRVSPVRGQLEPYDPTTARNWRYIQTTDTPNELKVLLPPSVASMYEQLLKLEVLELEKHATVSWERILEIRHLKDRMIRKCQRLSRVIPPKRIGRGDPFVFQTLITPEDFRLKEMETWFHQEQSRHKGRSAAHRPTVQKVHSRNSCCVRCARATQSDLAVSAPSTAPAMKLGQTRSLKQVGSNSLENTPTSSRAVSLTKTVKEEPSPPQIPTPINLEIPDPPLPVLEDIASEATKPIDAEVVQVAPTADTSPPADTEEQHDSSDSSTIAPTPPPSPPPLPHLLRISDPSLLKDILETETPPVIAPMPEPPAPRPPLVRRRSCIKLKRSSVGDSVKTVSWADDREWTERFPKMAVTPEPVIVEEPGSTWGENYNEHVSRLDILHRELTKSLEEIQADPAHFRAVDAIISDHKLRVTANCYVGQIATLLEQGKYLPLFHIPFRLFCCSTRGR
ncbi:hypothetical protein IW261DRAFT_227412 [Armillaria novae-zelandiae]|uniref:Uncharacterized protein n=1 Tax=Armillaria novae-zelandiae TaxID=153914 RepID=A0AA39UGX9_9AGAR|nr:hypothetical protein IW261DRAFT_227412 [Armillaria novae-zelandiae]